MKEKKSRCLNGSTEATPGIGHFPKETPFNLPREEAQLLEEANQAANVNSVASHKESIHADIIISLVSIGIDGPSAKHIVKNMIASKIDNVEIKY